MSGPSTARLEYCKRDNSGIEKLLQSSWRNYAWATTPSLGGLNKVQMQIQIQQIYIINL